MGKIATGEYLNTTFGTSFYPTNKCFTKQEILGSSSLIISGNYANVQVVQEQDISGNGVLANYLYRYTIDLDKADTSTIFSGIRIDLGRMGLTIIDQQETLTQLVQGINTGVIYVKTKEPLNPYNDLQMNTWLNINTGAGGQTIYYDVEWRTDSNNGSKTKEIYQYGPIIQGAMFDNPGKYEHEIYIKVRVYL